MRKHPVNAGFYSEMCPVASSLDEKELGSCHSFLMSKDRTFSETHICEDRSILYMFFHSYSVSQTHSKGLYFTHNNNEKA